MRVLMYGWEYPPHITGGLGTACHGLSTALSYLVSEITFILPRLKGKPPAGRVNLVSASDLTRTLHHTDQFTVKNLQTLTIASTLHPYLTAWEYESQMRLLAQERSHEGYMSVFGFSGDYGANLFDEVTRYGQIAGHAVLDRPYDVIHAHDWMTFLAGVKAKELSGLPLIIHVHALEFDRSGEQIDQRIYDIERFGMQAANRIIAVSQRTKDIIVNRYGIDQNKVTVVYNGTFPHDPIPLPTHKRTRPLPGKTVVFLGRITLQKGPEYFLEAAYLTSKKMDDVRFVMAGSGDLLPKMISRMAELKLLDRFHFTGFVGENQRAMLLSEADLFVMPSVSEPFGITPIEAIQYDVPVIVTKQSGIAEILFNAVKVDFWDVRKIADAMINILSSKELSRQLIEGSRRELLNMSWDSAAAKVNQIYQEIM